MSNIQKLINLLLAILASSILSTRSDEIGQKLATINSQGLPESILYEAAGLNPNDRSALTKAQLAQALKDPKIQEAAIHSALEYASKKADIQAPPSIPSNTRDGDTSSYCEYSWVAMLPFMDCPNAEIAGSTKEISVKETRDV